MACADLSWWQDWGACLTLWDPRPPDQLTSCSCTHTALYTTSSINLNLFHNAANDNQLYTYKVNLMLDKSVSFLFISLHDVKWNVNSLVTYFDFWSVIIAHHAVPEACYIYTSYQGLHLNQPSITRDDVSSPTIQCDIMYSVTWPLGIQAEALNIVLHQRSFRCLQYSSLCLNVTPV